MKGATAIAALGGGVAPGLDPLVVGLLSGLVGYRVSGPRIIGGGE